MRGFSVWTWLAIQVITLPYRAPTQSYSSEETGGLMRGRTLAGQFSRTFDSQENSDWYTEGTPTEILIGRAHHRFSALTCNCRIILYSLIYLQPTIITVIKVGMAMPTTWAEE
jgi:hypothetical protein